MSKPMSKPSGNTSNLSIQWLGHSAFKIKTPEVCVLIDPFLTGNPSASCTWQQAAEGATHIVLTHGHADHVGDTVAIAGKHHIPVLGMVELVQALAKQRVKNTEMANVGGSIDIAKGHTVSFVNAHHSTGWGEDELGHAGYMGVAAGVVLTTPYGVIYHAGDTAIFGDMELIDALYEPEIGLIPIGGRFTMDAKAAVLACTEFFQFESIIPMHYGTFPMLAPDAAEFVKLGKNNDLPIDVIKPGDVIKY
jgi:L-ascorbate metabolism protein UlaG (beta-lactamase superfamily)